MKPYKRTQRVNRQIQRLLAVLIRTRLTESWVQDVVITSVVVSPDLSVAKVYVHTVTGKASDAVDGLNEVKGFLRTGLAGEFRAKRVPELRFFVDDTMERVERLEALFERIHQDD